MHFDEGGDGGSGVTAGPTLADAARRYVARGWPVFPCLPRDKRPHGRLAPNGLKNATTDAEQAAEWWQAEPDANIGLATGIAFDVLDVDGDDGWRSLARAIGENGCLTSSPVALTPRGGAHYYFRPTGVGNRASFRPHLDWRGAGGYVIAPPSVGANGAYYGWGVAPGTQELQDVPPWLLELLQRPKPSTAPAGVSLFRGTPYGRQALEGECGRVALAAEGCRNDTLVRAAFRVGQLVASRDIDLDDAYSSLVIAGIRSGLPEDEAKRTVESGMEAGLREPRRVV